MKQHNQFLSRHYNSVWPYTTLLLGPSLPTLSSRKTGCSHEETQLATIHSRVVKPRTSESIWKRIKMCSTVTHEGFENVWFCSKLMWFITQQYFINHNHCKSLKPYKTVHISHNPSPQNHHYSVVTTSNFNLFNNFSIRGTFL